MAGKIADPRQILEAGGKSNGVRVEPATFGLPLGILNGARTVFAAGVLICVNAGRRTTGQHVWNATGSPGKQAQLVQKAARKAVRLGLYAMR